MAAKQLLTEQEVRDKLRIRMSTEKLTQADVARLAKVPAQTVSVMLQGVPIGGKVLSWLGFERAETMYRLRSNAEGAK